MIADGTGTLRDIDAIALFDYLKAAGVVTPVTTGRVVQVP